jgi:tetratricopeptide (TPR) repeat protein
MSKKLIPILALFLAVIGISVWLISKPAKTAELEIPDLSPRAGETSPSPEFLKAQGTIKRYRDELRAHPEVVKNYIEVAQVYIQEARVTGRHDRYYPIADKIIDGALTHEPDNFDATILKASMRMTMHQFSSAKELAEKAIAKNPYSSFAYGVLCDAHVELGLYDSAVQDCDKMMRTRPDLRSYARASYLREINGDRPGAIEAMKLAADAGQFGDENREWALYNLANVFYGMGKLDTAAYIYKGILEERPTYAFAMSGLGLVSAAKGDNAGAIEWLVRASQISPEHIFVEELADVYSAMGDKQSAKTFEDKAYAAFVAHEASGWDVDREYAVFALNHNQNLDEALTRAKREYDRRPMNIDALDTYAWALYKNGRGGEARPLMTEAMRMHTENGLLHYHAAAIESALGHSVEAASEIQTAFDETPYLTISALPPARQLRQSLQLVASAR